MASSIKLFSFNRKYYYIYGIYPLQPNRFGQSLNLRNWIFVASFSIQPLPSGAFFFSDAQSMFEYGISFLLGSTSVILVCIYLEMVWQMENTWPFIEHCERFIEKRKNSIGTYRRAVESIQRLNEFLGVASVVTILSQTLPFLLYTLINYYIFDLGDESFVLFYPVKWPFDWKTPLGYLAAWLVQSAGIIAISSFVLLSLNFIFESCWLFIVMAEDITEDLVAVNNDIKLKGNSEESVKWDEIVELYLDTKQCVDEFNSVARYALLLLLLFYVVSVSCVLLTLQFQLMDVDEELFETFVLSMIVFWIFGSLFIICELGKQITSQFDMFDEELKRCDWHTLSIKMQRMYLIFSLDTQQPKYIQCYGGIKCTRETFKKIIKTGFSYFMTLRSFEV